MPFRCMTNALSRTGSACRIAAAAAGEAEPVRHTARTATGKCAESSSPQGVGGRRRRLLGRFRHLQWVTGDDCGGRAVQYSSATAEKCAVRNRAEWCTEIYHIVRPSTDRQGWSYSRPWRGVQRASWGRRSRARASAPPPPAPPAWLRRK
eukprot:2775977-Prymnesium_polylepis.1